MVFFFSIFAALESGLIQEGRVLVEKSLCSNDEQAGSILSQDGNCLGPVVNLGFSGKDDLGTRHVVCLHYWGCGRIRGRVALGFPSYTRPLGLRHLCRLVHKIWFGIDCITRRDGKRDVWLSTQEGSFAPAAFGVFSSGIFFSGIWGLEVPNCLVIYV